MEQRIAYLGLSYPLLYDYSHAQRLGSRRELPNPVIDSPLGLMILYDELWFLSEALCPLNMRTLPYVKFVNRMFPDFDFKRIDDCLNENSYALPGFQLISYQEALDRMNIGGALRDQMARLDNHSRDVLLGGTSCFGRNDERAFLFDLLVWSGLKERTAAAVELVANSSVSPELRVSGNETAALAEQIIVRGLPNYLSVQGPYHACMEELRDHSYARDFRRWITAEHAHVQRAETAEAAEAVYRAAEETRRAVFDRYLADRSVWGCFRSTAKTILTTAAGIPYPIVSVAAAGADILSAVTATRQAKAQRWAGFVLHARQVMEQG